jgi:hypothetical protein
MHFVMEPVKLHVGSTLIRFLQIETQLSKNNNK